MNPKLFPLSFILTFVAVGASTGTGTGTGTGFPILDTDGDELCAGTPYYISPIGIGLPPNTSTRCPVGIILTTATALPVTLWPVDPNQTVITTSTKFYAKFPTFQTGCMDHNLFWKVAYDGGIGLSFVLLGEPADEFEMVEDEEEKSGAYLFTTQTSESKYKIGAVRDVWDLNTWLFINNKGDDAPFNIQQFKAVFSKASISTA